MTDPLRAALRDNRERVRRWLDAEDLADSLAASEGADSYASHDTSDAADHWLTDLVDTLRPGLDVERLEDALHEYDRGGWLGGDRSERYRAEWVAAEYARLTEDRP